MHVCNQKCTFVFFRARVHISKLDRFSAEFKAMSTEERARNYQKLVQLREDQRLLDLAQKKAKETLEKR